MYAGIANDSCASSLQFAMDVVDDRLVHVPSDEIDGRQRRHRAPGMRPDQIVDVRDAMLCRQLRSLVQDLEADAIADERRACPW